jgi:prepilin-type N-terminal cleavage/methylation domain-containing protein
VRVDSLRAEHGFSLIEVLVAAAILAVGLLSLAQLLAMTVSANAAAGRTTYAAALAAQKLEDLRAEPWSVLEANIGESADFLDRSGSSIDASSTAAFRRRWFVEPWFGDPAHTLVIRVIVTTAREEAATITVRTRTSP